MKHFVISFLAAAALVGCAKLGLETVESTPSEGQTPFVLYVSTRPGTGSLPRQRRRLMRRPTW